MRGDKIINFKTVTGGYSKGEINCIDGAYVLDELIHDLIKKHDEIVAKSNGQIRAVAFNFLYSQDCRIIDICNAYIDNHREFENILVANRMSTALYANTTKAVTFYRPLGNNTKSYLNPKYFVISKRGINKAKLHPDEVYFYNHLEILLAQKLTFDKLLEESIVKRMDALVKWNNIVIESRAMIEQRAPKKRKANKGICHVETNS